MKHLSYAKVQWWYATINAIRAKRTAGDGVLRLRLGRVKYSDLTPSAGQLEATRDLINSVRGRKVRS